MLLTNDEMQLVRQAVEVQAGIDQELILRCGPLVHISAFDEAVRQAFVLLEERMRKILNKERLTGMQMVQYAFSNDGPFTKMFADSPAERDGFEHLLSGAFKLYRNPSAHTIVGYDRAEARAIINLVDLLLKRLDRLGAVPQPGTLPANIEHILLLIEKTANPKVSSLVRMFIGKCIKEGLEVRQSAKQWVPLRKQALIKRPEWVTAKPHALTVLYLYTTEKEQALWFPVNQYYSHVVDLNTDQIKSRLRSLGFQTYGKSQDYYMYITSQKDKPFFDELFILVKQIIVELNVSLVR